MMINLREVSKEYGQVQALDSVSLTVETSEEVTIMGPSGSGKTTLVNLIAGLDTPTSGRVSVNGTELSNLSREGLAAFRRDNVGIVFQQFHLIPYLTAVENIMLAQYFHSLPERKDALRSLEMVGLSDRGGHKPGELSGGEQQRVAIARAITNDPPVILADEPTGNLDRENEQKVVEIFRDLRDAGKTLILVTHNPNITDYSDRVLHLDYGQLVRTRQPSIHS